MASFWVQADALVRKNASYQSRRIWTNACLIVTPILLLGLIFVFQQLSDKYSNTPEFTCGCMCTKCCESNGSCREAAGSSQCHSNETCAEFNKEVCGPRFSTDAQAIFCAVNHPSSWPPLFKIRHHGKFELPPWENGVGLMYTGENLDIVEQIVQSEFSALGQYNGTSLQYVQKFIQESQEFFKSGDFVVRGEVLSELGLTVATRTGESFPNYIDNALLNFGVQSSLLATDCGNLQMLAPFVEVMMKDLANVVESKAHSKTEGGNSELSCSKAEVHRAEGGVPEINKKLFCNFAEAGCSKEERQIGGKVLREYSTAWDFKDTDENAFSVAMWVPSQTPLSLSHGRVNLGQNLATNAWIKWNLGDSGYSAKLLALQEHPKPESNYGVDIASLAGPLLLTWIIEMIIPVMLVHLVYEKEVGLETMMKLMGLSDATNFVVNYMYYFFLYSAYMVVFLIAGSLINWVIFTKNSYGIQILFYFVIGHNQIAFAFTLSSLFQKSQTASSFAYVWIIASGLVAQLLYERFVRQAVWFTVLFELIPPFAIYRGLWELASYAQLASFQKSYGLTWAKLMDENNGMIRVCVISTLEWVVFMLAILLWTKGTSLCGCKLKRQSHMRRMGSVVRNMQYQNLEMANRRPSGLELPSPSSNDIEDDPENADNIAILTQNLRKVFPPVGSVPRKVAVSGLDLAVEKGEVFGLLGPNGAGKSTVINMMTGLIKASSGRAFIEGLDVKSDFQEIHKRMGVCPQHDKLWFSLTGREHLSFYGRLKGIPKKDLSKAVKDALTSVGLRNGGVGDKRVQTYSGGMKRRLSVAIALIGSPSIMYLDEPSTGMDLFSRRKLWDAIRLTRAHSSIVLTTHSMEEAEALCDRIGIFVDGRLVCLGSPKALKAQHGGYMVLSIVSHPDHVAYVAQTVEENWRFSKLAYSMGGVLKFELPSTVSLANIFHTMARRLNREVVDWSVSHASLEEVFIRIVRRQFTNSTPHD